MASFPAALYAPTNPTATDVLNSATVPHATQHAAANNEIVAIETALGTNLSAVAALGVANTFTVGGQIIAAGSDTVVPLVLKRNSLSSSADIQQLQQNSGAVLGGKNAAGQIYSGATTINSAIGGATVSATGTGTVATITLTTAHGLAVGQLVTVAGVTPLAFNGVYQVTVVGTTTAFSYASTATGPQTVAGTVTTPAQMSAIANGPSAKGMVIRAAASQVANIQEWQNSAGVLLARIQTNGGFSTPNINAQSGVVSIGLGAGATFSSDAANVPIIAKGVSAQTADLQQWQASNATVLANVTAGGIISSAGMDTSSGTGVTAPSVSSGVAFTPSTTKNAQVTFQLAGITGSYTVTYGPSAGTENTLASAVPTLSNVGDVVSFMVPKAWKMVITLTTVTLAATLVTTF